MCRQEAKSSVRIWVRLRMGIRLEVIPRGTVTIPMKRKNKRWSAKRTEKDKILHRSQIYQLQILHTTNSESVDCI